jgi:dTDP-4-amino-4,6-dideoxygalactose transaminase
MIPVARPYVGEEEELGVIEVLRSGWLTQGPQVAAFEAKFAAYVGCDHAVAVSSCTTALQLALWACGVGSGDEVICPSFSFIATANCIACTGAKAVFADIDLATYNVDPIQVEALVSPRTKAILAVHQIGLPADMKALRAIADKHGLMLIEDAACAIGSEYDGELIGRPIGDLACFSFHPRKIMTTGEGGMITTRDAHMAERLRKLRQHAMSVSDTARHNAKRVVTEVYDEIGFNYRMTDMQAAVGIAQLGRLDSLLERRRDLARRYTDALKSLPWLATPHVPENCRHNYQSYMVRLLGDAAIRRTEIMQEMLEKNISTRRAVMAIHREEPYKDGNWEERLPQTCVASDTGIILPLFHQMTETEHAYVIDALLDAAT